MKFFILFIMLTSVAFATDSVQKQPSPNTESISNTTQIPPTQEEKQEMRDRAEGMGGAPNVGTGMGTGTGAGSTVGKEIKGDEENLDDE